MGQLVERLSGRSLEAYVRRHILDPLGMGDTGFLLRPDQRSRLAGMHRRQPDGSLRAIELEVPRQPEFLEGGGGLYSTGPDYLRFLRMLLGGGRLDGARVLRPETVAAMGTNQIGELTAGVLMTVDPVGSNTVVEYEFHPGTVKRWGLGARITTEEAPTGRSAGSLAWAGAYNTFFWLDPLRRVTGVLMAQVRPFPDAGVLDLFVRFERAVYAGYTGHGP